MLLSPLSGTGEAAAIEFAKRDANVILACRSRERGIAAKKRILKAAGLRPDDKNVEVKIIDTSSLQSVRDFVADVKASVEK